MTLYFFSPSAARRAHSILCVLAFLLVVVVGCADDSVEPPPDTGDTRVTVEPNQKLAAWPHRFDVYRVQGADNLIVFLHGGGGTKEYSAYQLGLKATPDGSSYAVANGQVLVDGKTIVVFPQGQTLPAAPNTPTWNNYVMDSGEDDVQFIRDLMDYLTDKYSISRTGIAGHSNGGMMVNRIWCEAPELFDCFVAISGPPSQHFLGVPCSPAQVKPILSIVGSEDGVLQNTDWEAQTWTIDPLLTQSAAFVDPVLIGDRYFFPTKVTQGCSGTVAPGDADAVTNGNLRTWTFCDSTIQMIRIETAGHSVESLQGTSGLSLLALAIAFCAP